MDDFRDTDRATMKDLREAFRLWEDGDTLPLDLASRLMAAGYDVGSLEARYRV